MNLIRQDLKLCHFVIKYSSITQSKWHIITDSQSLNAAVVCEIFRALVGPRASPYLYDNCGWMCIFISNSIYIFYGLYLFQICITVVDLFHFEQHLSCFDFVSEMKVSYCCRNVKTSVNAFDLFSMTVFASATCANKHVFLERWSKLEQATELTHAGHVFLLVQLGQQIRFLLALYIFSLALKQTYLPTYFYHLRLAADFIQSHIPKGNKSSSSKSQKYL